jgi:TPR repeat protein
MPQHTRDCEERAAELRDEILFKQPESSHYGDCPICLLPLRIDGMKSTMYSCCCKMICDGCGYANQMRELEESLEQKCPFCRHPRPRSQEESVRNRMKRAEANDPVALREVGKQCCHDGDYDAAFQYLSKAAELGDVGAHYELSVMYNEEEGVEKDDKKELHHLEQAAIGGHPDARINLGCVEEENGRADRAIKHWIIAATLGSDDSLDA